jgi:hypothetical protein
MSTEQEHRREELAGQLGQALGAAAELMTQRIEAGSTVRRARPAAPMRRARGRLGGWLHGWLVPLAAAVAVALAVVGSVIIARSHLGAAQPSTTTGVPAFYLTMDGLHTPQIEVHRTSDGAVTSRLSLSPRWRVEGMSAAAGDRTFFVTESAIGSNGIGTCPADRFLRFGVTGSGAITAPRQVGAQVKGMVSAPSVSPDGTRLAYSTACTTDVQSAPVWALHVMDLASGAVSTWTNEVTTTRRTDVAEIESLAWTADSRSLSVDYEWMTLGTYASGQAIMLLNTDSGAGTLQARGRAIWQQNTGCTTCVYDALISPDGTSLVASTSKYSGGGSDHETFDTSLVRISLPAGRVTGVLFRTTMLSPGNGVARLPLWPDSSGRYWIVKRGSSLGWVSDGQFHRMQPFGTVQQAAWLASFRAGFRARSAIPTAWTNGEPRSDSPGWTNTSRTCWRTTARRSRKVHMPRSGRRRGLLAPDGRG